MLAPSLVVLEEEPHPFLGQWAIAFESAKLIARIKETRPRRKLLKQAIAQSLSISEIKKNIKALKSAPTQAPPKDSYDDINQEMTVFKSSVRNAYKSIAKYPRIADDPERLAQAEQLFNLFLVNVSSMAENV